MMRGLVDLGHHANGNGDASPSEQAPKGRYYRIAEAPSPERSVEAELQALRARLHEQEWHLRRAEAEHEKTLAAYTRFVQDVTASSAAPTLQNYVDLSTKEILGSGHFGYVFTCRARRKAFLGKDAGGMQELSQRVVVKVQSARQADSVVKEWHHGSARSQHPHMVKHLKVLIHSDAQEEIKSFLEDAFSSGALKGKPRSMPDQWLCILEEYMDGGTAQYLMDEKLLQPEGIAAILRQVADAVSALHAAQETHNDIKPENVLLKVHSSAGIGRVKLVAKLADMGSAEYSVDRSRDIDLLAYTVWCMVMGAAFKKCPSGDGQRQSALCALREAAAAWPERQLQQGLPDAVEQLWQGRCDLKELQALPWLRNCEITVPEGLAVGVDMKVASRKSIIANAERRSTSRASTVLGLSPMNLRKLQGMCLEGSRSPSGSAAASDDDCPLDKDTTNRKSYVAEPPIELKDRKRSTSAGAGQRGRRGVAARQGRPAFEESPKPPGTARLAGEGHVASAVGLAGGRGALASPSRPGSILRQKGTNSSSKVDTTNNNSKVDNLMMRFPSRSREEVMEALREACGHAGHAAEALRKSVKD